MKKIFSILLINIIIQCGWAQSGEGYNPESPSDPAMYYHLTLKAIPQNGGKAYCYDKSYTGGERFYFYTTTNKGYVFKNWTIGDSIISTSKDFYLTMPYSDVSMTANFAIDSTYVYNPTSPEDPSFEGNKHRVSITAIPNDAGYFDYTNDVGYFDYTNDFGLTEGDSIHIYARPRSGYRFVSWKQNDAIISTSNPLKIKMGTKDLEYSAQFVYDPQNPQNPGSNNFNIATGELIVDDFNPGELQRAISDAVGENDLSLVQSIIIAGKLSTYDLTYASYIKNCSLIDIARTSGFSEIPSYVLEGNTSLTKIILPSCVNSIDNYAFNGCISLSELVCHATTPPALYKYSFSGISDGLIVRVPSNAVELYKKSQWNSFTIIPLDEGTNKITVSLPADAADGRYKNLTLELNNITNGQVLKMLITEKDKYVFTNLINTTKYNILIKNSRGVVLGSMVDILLEKEDIEVAFDTLLQPQTIQIAATDETGNNLTDKVSVVWKDENGNYIAQGTSLEGFVKGNKLYYAIQLSEDLSLKYITPKVQSYIVVDGKNQITYTLKPLEKIKISGYIVEQESGKAIIGANVTLSQSIGKHATSIVVCPNSDGLFEAQIYNMPVSICASSSNCHNNIIDITEVYDGMNIGSLQMNRLSGQIIDLKFTYKQNHEEGQLPEVQEGFYDFKNITYKIYNKTDNKEITEFIVQGSSIVLTEQIENGTVLEITAISKDGTFTPVVTEHTYDNTEISSVNIPIVEKGELVSEYSQSENIKNTALLYNEKGKLVCRSNYSENKVSFTNLEDGEYTIVGICSNHDFNTILNLSGFAEIGLTENVDYVCKNVTIKSGNITKTLFDNIPKIDLSKYSYTGSNTRFSVNKQSVTIGNYITLRSVIDFKSKYIGAISNVNLIIDLPENCKFVDNSVLTNNGIGGYTLLNQRIIVPLSSLNDNIRFCIIPTVSGEYSPNAFVSFDIDNETLIQPIGSAVFSAESLKLSVPEKTSITSIIVKGYAPADSEVLVYDNNVLVGKAIAMANGEWKTKVELHKPYSWSFHTMYANIITPDGETLSTSNQKLEYDKHATIPSKITMLYNGISIVFDEIQRLNNIYNYSYDPNTTNFTFLAEFTNTDPSLIKNLEFIVLLSDGSRRVLQSTFNKEKGLWIANAEFSNTRRLPVNVKTRYISPTTKYDDKEAFNDHIDALTSYGKNILNYYEQNLNLTLIEDEEKRAVYDFDLTGEVKLKYSFEVIDYNEAIDYLKQQDYEYGYSEGYRIIYATTFDDDKIEVVSVLVDEEYAVKISLYQTEQGKLKKAINTTAAINLLKESLRNGKLLAGITEWTGHILDLLGTRDYFPVENQLNTMCDYTDHYIDLDLKWNETVMNLLLAKCDDGSYKLDTEQRKALYQEKLDISTNASQFHNNCYSYIEKYKSTLKKKIAFDLVSLGIGKAIGALGEADKFVNSKLINLVTSMLSTCVKNETAAKIMTNTVGIILNTITDAANPKFADFEAVYVSFLEWSSGENNKYTSQYDNLCTRIKGSYKKCKKEEEEDEGDDDFSNPPITPAIDPAGYVYEGVSSNRVEGATATCYYKEMVEDMYGDLHENIVKWDAEEYAQENPLFTDANGMYRWDVPQGLWQVKFEKEGYETTYSDWLPVPPPQLEVNVAMTQNKQPEIKGVKAYADGVVVEFDKYMLPATLNNENIIVNENGKNVEGTVEMLNEEISYEGKTTKYASKVRFVPTMPFTAKEVTLLVSNKVKSYAGIAMQDNFQQSFEIEKEIKEIVVSDTISIPYEGSAEVTVTVLPADAAHGKVLRATSASSMIASLGECDAIIDEDGTAQFVIIGELIGASNIAFEIADVDIKSSTYIKVVEDKQNIIDAPTASLISGASVYRGTEVKLETANNEYKIWYTTDDSCPCDENGSRRLYNGPIVIDNDIRIKAMAENNDGEASDIATFVYKIMQSTSGVVLGKGWNWVTFNMKNETLNNVNDALSCGSWNIGDEIKNNLFTDSYSVKQDKWVGTLSKNGNISNAGMYMIHSTTAQTLNIIGEAIHPTEIAINVGSGWNYIGYLPLGILSVTEALADYPAEENDVIKSQDAFAIYSSENGWNGSLETLHPGEGYMLKRANNAQNITFHYPATVIKNNTRVSKAKQHRYANNMNVIARVNGVELQQEDSIIAYADKEIRGCNRIDENGNIFLTIMGDEQADINLSVVRNGEVIASNNKSLKYEPNTIIGTAGKPTEINFVTDENTSLFQIAPNVIFDNMTIFINEQEIHSLLISVHNTSGLLVKEYSESHINGACERTLDMSELPTGIYLVKIIINDNSKIIKIIKK